MTRGVAAARRLAFGLVLALAPGAAPAHDPAPDKPGQAASETQAPAAPSAAFPFRIGGPFQLVDHTGQPVSDRDFHGSHLLVFFGYASCKSICPVALPAMAEALEILGADGAHIQPLFITVDPENDTPEVLAAFAVKIHPRLIGLTGSPEALHTVAKAYRTESKKVGQAWTGGPVFSHGSYIYLMAPDGAFATLLPPVMDPRTMASTIARYL